ncbi:MAG: phage major capsid protein [Phycisphaerales bacterium]|nr:phage major capsid protein [Phycisphaerales bacterium]
MNLNEMKAKYVAILETGKTENRSFTAAEITEMDNLKAEIAKAEKAATEGVQKAIEERNAAAARLQGPDTMRMKTNEYLRSIAKGSQNVGNLEVVNDVVRQFNQTSPIFAAHQNVQMRSTGNSFEFTRISAGGAGYVKTEGNAGTSDTASAATMVAVPFKTYSGQTILVTQEALDDYAADISQEVIVLGTAKATVAFGADCVAALKSAFTTTTATAGTSWTLADVTAAYYEIPVRNRYNIKYTCNPATAKALANLITLNTSPQAEWIDLKKENIVEDESMDADLLFVGDLTQALAIGLKQPVRVFVQEVSQGTNFEAQPRLAVALRDATALAARKLKTT